MRRRGHPNSGAGAGAEFPAKKNRGATGANDGTELERNVWAGYTNVYQLYACLIDAPYHLTFADIAELTDRQIYDLYYRERDKDGTPEPIADPEAEWQRKDVAEDLDTPEERAKAKSKYLTMALAFGMDFKAAEAKWAEAEEKHRGRN